MTDYNDIWYTSHDGLSLYARDYSKALSKNSNAEVILCMHGLTRNSADFEDICYELADEYRLIVVDQRGRGLSEYDPEPNNYNPLVYVEDMFLLLETLEISSVTLLGTSMGGIMAILMAAMKPEMIKAVIINDVGPEVAEEGLERLKKYVGKQAPVRNWEEAIKRTESINGIAFPDTDEQFWVKFTKRLYREDNNGCPVVAYDPKIAIPLISNDDSANKSSAAPDLWPVYEKFLDMPILLIRGELSDIIDVDCVQKMQQMKPDLEVLELPNVGHAPLLSEPTVTATIRKFLNSKV